MSESQIVLWLAGQIIVGAAIWGGIRADIRGMHIRMEHAETAILNERYRIDKLMERRASDKT